MVRFELGKELRKMFFVLSRTWDKEKILSPHEVWDLIEVVYLVAKPLIWSEAEFDHVVKETSTYLAW